MRELGASERIPGTRQRNPLQPHLLGTHPFNPARFQPPVGKPGAWRKTVDKYREMTTLPWRSAISGGEKSRSYCSEIAGGIVLALIVIALVVGAMLL